MSNLPFTPTDEQKAVIKHTGSAFISACPGAGKTRVLIERIKKIHDDLTSKNGIAVLSFTNAAISELETRIQAQGLLRTPRFPSFVGTFDSFVWEFLVGPFGVPNVDEKPTLIPDIQELTVQPYDKALPLPLKCFDRDTGNIIRDNAEKRGLKPTMKTRAHEGYARSLRKTLRENAYIDFEDSRNIANQWLSDTGFRERIGRALASRFCEIIVDEAQDCNAKDISILEWLQDTGIPLKIICDPDQAIYGFRGGISSELKALSDKFSPDNRLKLTGNFRSTRNICLGTGTLRSPGNQIADTALGENRKLTTEIKVISYGGRTVPVSVGETFYDLVSKMKLPSSECPIIAHKLDTGRRAIGLQPKTSSSASAIQLASAVATFHSPKCTSKDRLDTLRSTHNLLLRIQGVLTDTTYHAYVSEKIDDDKAWRGTVYSFLQSLDFFSSQFSTAKQWHEFAKIKVAEQIDIPTGKTIGQLLRWDSSLEKHLVNSPIHEARTHTIHSVKGQEFPAVCVVTSIKTAKSIFDYLLSTGSGDESERARVLYVGATRAENLLVIAAPKSQADRLAKHLAHLGAPIDVIKV